MEELQRQILALQTQINNQEIKFKSSAAHFNLTADQIIRNFSDIQPFSGDNNYKLKSFLKAVDDAEILCGEENDTLKTYCLRKTINNKIIGPARNVILEIPEDKRTWSCITTQLKLRFRPKNTINNLLFQAKNLRVSNLKELFYKFSHIKSECTEICDFDDENQFTYGNIDKELVKLLTLKLIPILQVQVNKNLSLYELDNSFCQTEAYYDQTLIKFEYRLKSNNYKNISNYKNHNSNNQNTFKRSNNFYNHNNNNDNNNYNNTIDSRQFNNTEQNRQNSERFTNNSQQFRRSGTGQYKQPQQHNYSGQFKQSGQFRQSGQSNQYRNRPEPMEVDTINKTEEVNFEANSMENPCFNQLPIVKLTFESKAINCLIDSGSDTSLIKPDILNYKISRMETPLNFSSLSGQTQISYTMQSPFPEEFVKNGTLEWKVYPLKSKKYDAIVGINFLKPFESKIDIKNQCLRIFDTFTIPFENIDYPKELIEVNHLEPIGNNKEEISNKIKLDHLNDEEKKILKNLLIKNQDLFYNEGDNLTFTHEIKHEIKLKHNNPVFCKIYRYPQVHETEINSQIKDMLKQGIIRESNSPYNSPLWIVTKKIDNSNKKNGE